MSTLQDHGFRFMVNQDRKGCDWIHPAEVSLKAADWIDCTDMNDAEFDAFMGVVWGAAIEFVAR
jgi:hypothetical protein